VRRLTALIAALAIAVLGAGVFPAYADGPTATPTPSSRPGDPFGGQTLPPGPVYVITPGSTATTLPPTSDPSTVQEQIKKDIKKARTEKPSVIPTGTASATPGGVVPSAGTTDAPATEDASTAVVHRASSSSHAWVWWVLIVALIAVAGVVVVRVRRRRTDEQDPGVA
jgi:cobalamin biosynthesis Mg chelatase CobN